MVSRWLSGTNKLKKCDEFRTDICDTEKHDSCCSVAPCVICLKFEEYGTDPEYGSADFATNSWSGTVAGLAFVAYWERNQYTDECEFVVIFDDEEVYRASCYEGASCRDPGGSVEVSIPYADGTLTWSVDRKRPLPYVVDPDTGCRTHFCGNCECTAECLCVTVTDGYSGEVSTGEICDISYSDCDAPLWEGTVGDHLISLELSRDRYGECILLVSVDGIEEDPVYPEGCTNLSATIELYDGTVIQIAGKECVCRTDFPCCPGLSFPSFLHLTLISMNTECGCLDGQIIPLAFSAEFGGRYEYVGIWINTCVINGDPSKVYWYKFTTSCGSPENFPIIVVETIEDGGATEPTVNDPRWVVQTSYLVTSGQCDPFYFYYALAGPGSPQNDIWLNCDQSSMDTPWVELELTL